MLSTLYFLPIEYVFLLIEFHRVCPNLYRNSAVLAPLPGHRGQRHDTKDFQLHQAVADGSGSNTFNRVGRLP